MTHPPAGSDKTALEVAIEMAMEYIFERGGSLPLDVMKARAEGELRKIISFHRQGQPAGSAAPQEEMPEPKFDLEYRHDPVKLWQFAAALRVWWNAHAERLQRERNELREALRILVDACSEKTDHGTLRVHPNIGAFEIALQALAKVKP